MMPYNCFKLQEGTTTKSARFRSNLLGSIGAGVVVGPNTINFNTVFDNPEPKLKDVRYFNYFNYSKTMQM